jgi:Family of unknown function (DUF6263)
MVIMKSILITLIAVSATTLVFSQTAKYSDRIIITQGQKLTVQNNISFEANFGAGMDLTSTSATENALEVKNSSDKSYTISSTTKKIKVDMNMMGQSTRYDSEKSQGPSNDIEKVLAEKLNKPVDILVNNYTGAVYNEMVEKKDADGNPVGGMVNMFADNSDDAIVDGAFELVPQGKAIGDSWADTSVSKEMKRINRYTLKSVAGSEAVIQLDAITNAINKVELQGMQIEFKTETKTTGEITTDVSTGLVRKKTTQADIKGSFQLMGQEMPISAKANATSVYK